MSDKEFIQLLEKAVENDELAIFRVIKLYENLIIKNSIVNGRYDEDCRAYIESSLVKIIRNFKNF